MRSYVMTRLLPEINKYISLIISFKNMNKKNKKKKTIGSNKRNVVL